MIPIGRRVWNFVIETASQLFFFLIGFALLVVSFVDKSLAPQAVLFYQGIGLGLAATAYGRLLEYWMGMDPNAKILRKMEDQRQEYLAEFSKLNIMVSEIATHLKSHMYNSPNLPQNPQPLDPEQP